MSPFVKHPMNDSLPEWEGALSSGDLSKVDGCAEVSLLLGDITDEQAQHIKQTARNAPLELRRTLESFGLI